jgi:DNA (cytosine-5)-methyltransferase 1
MGALTYGSVCSGIEAATVAWHPLGWRPAFFSEIEAFPRAVLQHHYPETPLHGDFTTIGADEYGAIDLLVGGTPCQSFSIAGLRGGLADDRGNLSLEYIRLARRKRTRWLVWENVPGVFSSNGGRDFQCFLSGLVGWLVPIPAGGWQNSGIIAPGPSDSSYGVAWGVLDAQHFGVPQRRRRIILVGHLGDWRRAAAVLFERHSLQGNPPPRRETGQGTAASASIGFEECRWPADVAPTLNAHFGDKMGLENQHALNGAGHFVAHSLRGEGFDASEDGTGRGTPLVPVKTGFQGDSLVTSQMAWPCLSAQGGNNGGGPGAIYVNPAQSAVRRLTPRECERLQGFPDDYTAIPWRGKPADECPDGPRYKTLGNSMARPVMRWIGERIAAVEALSALREAA